MIEKLLRNFASENFGHKYFPVFHGKTQEIKPLVLLVKRDRSIWERPFKKLKYTTLGRLDKYLLKDEEERFLDLLNSNIVKEDPDLELDVDDEDGQAGAARSLEGGVNVANCVSAKIRISEELGFLILGKVDQEYINDLELREILATAHLDVKKTGAFKEVELRLITSVIYSERFEHKGVLQEEFQVDGAVQDPLHPYAHLKGHVKTKTIAPKIAVRNTRGPFLFKCCRVVYNEDTDQLELAKGEIIGKDVDVHRAVGDEDEECEEDSTALEGEQEDLTDSFTEEDVKTLCAIKETVLMPLKDREERKARIKKYLSWFEEALTTNQRKIFPDEGLSDADRKFLRGIFIPAFPNQCSVDLSKLGDETIQGVAIVLKIIADIPDAEWDEIEKAWDDREQCPK